MSDRPVDSVSCSTRTARARRLRTATALRRVNGQPFGVAMTASGQYVFAGLGAAVGIFTLEGIHLRLVTTVAVPEQVRGIALSPDGRYLIATDGAGGAYVLDVAQAEGGSSAALLGQLTSAGVGAIQATVSSNGTFAFVTLEYSDELAVFNLQRAIETGFASNTPVGLVPLGRDPVGVAASANGSYLYVTSEVVPPTSHGSLSVVSTARAETDPTRAVVQSVPAGCDPVRVIVHGRSMYVTARESNAVLWFSSASLAHGPRLALRGRVRVGPEPVGLATVDRGREILVADSNRFDTGKASGLAILQLKPGGRPILRGYLPTGTFPRDVASTGHGSRAVVADYGSSQLEALSVPVASRTVGRD
jgi:DNA-binding beta-propeller fold protein YncE